MTEEDYMRIAIEEARKAANRDEVPVGAVLVHAETGLIIAQNGNRTREYTDPTAHAEMLVTRKACQNEGSQRIPAYDLYVTLEPCAMCAAAISFSRIRNLYFGAPDEKGGGVRHGAQFYSLSTCHYRPYVSHGLFAEESGLILKDFFAQKRLSKS